MQGSEHTEHNPCCGRKGIQLCLTKSCMAEICALHLRTSSDLWSLIDARLTVLVLAKATDGGKIKPEATGTSWFPNKPLGYCKCPVRCQGSLNGIPLSLMKMYAPETLLPGITCLSVCIHS